MSACWRVRLARLRAIADVVFYKRYVHRAIVLETVAAIPGMVGGLVRHLRSLRTLKDDDGEAIRALLAEAETLFAELTASMAEPVLLHGDLHHENILAATRQPL